MKQVSKYVFYILLSIMAIRPWVYVQAEYMLPYPSVMPGNKIYKVTRVIDVIKGYWYWGNIAQMKYQLGLADKYLVEAKTLFEYKQYLLASDALQRSDVHVEKILPYVQKATSEGKDTSELRKTISEAMRVHIVQIAYLKVQLPQEFVWRPEKSSETSLPIRSMLDFSSSLRSNLIQQL